MNKIKFFIVILLISSTLIVSHAIPKPRYVGTGFISSLKIPDSVGEWHGKNVSSALKLDFDNDLNKFISEVLVYQYVNREGNKLNFIVLDAGNFHHPNVCFTAAGFALKERDDSELNIFDRTLKVHTVYTEKGQERYLSMYWIVIDKKITHEWIEQKIKQLYFSLFNRQRIGLMVRIDIPADESNADTAKETAQKFITALSLGIPHEKAEYLFGEIRLKDQLER